jgi:hypothetical protein
MVSKYSAHASKIIEEKLAAFCYRSFRVVVSSKSFLRQYDALGVLEKGVMVGKIESR